MSWHPKSKKVELYEDLLSIIKIWRNQIISPNAKLESQYCLESSSYVQGSPVNAYCGLFYLIFTKFYGIDTVTTFSFLDEKDEAQRD